MRERLVITSEVEVEYDQAHSGSRDRILSDLKKRANFEISISSADHGTLSSKTISTNIQPVVEKVEKVDRPANRKNKEE